MITYTTEDQTALLTLNRPKALNALCNELIAELIAGFKAADKDSSVGTIIVTGSERSFAAGADIKEMSSNTFSSCYNNNMLYEWEEIATIRKPIIAAVNGFALGGGCELALLCDMIIAGDNAVFGQPEVTIGTIPGGGATQRLTKLLGKYKAMELILTGGKINASQALEMGLVNKVVKKEETLEEAKKIARTINKFSKPIIAMAKECVNMAEDVGLTSGIRFEKRMFHATFGTGDQKEGMGAFVEKKAPKFEDK